MRGRTFIDKKSYTRNCMRLIKNVIRRIARNYSGLEKSYLKKLTFCKSLKYVFVCAIIVVFILSKGKQGKQFNAYSSHENNPGRRDDAYCTLFTVLLICIRIDKLDYLNGETDCLSVCK